MWWSWRNDDFQGRLETWHNDLDGIHELEKEFRRGDYIDPYQTWRIRRWVWKRTRELRKDFLNSPEGAGVKAANAALVSAWASVIAVLLSVVAISFSWLAYVKPDSVQKVKIESGANLFVEVKK
jgi:hypothetical protein